MSYAIGVVKPMGIFINTYGTSKVNLDDGAIAKIVDNVFDMRPYAIEQRLKLRNPIYFETAAYGHMGRLPQTIVKNFDSPYSGSCLLYTSPSPRDGLLSRMPSSA